MPTLDEKLIACLERIAFNTSPRNIDFKDYLETVVYANTGSKVQVQEGDKNTSSPSERKSTGIKKHVYGGYAHPLRVQRGQKEKEIVLLEGEKE